MTEEQSTMLLEKWCERNCKEICSKKMPCDNCVVTFIKQTLDINNRQKAEIKRLQTEKDSLIKTYKECMTEAIKEFAERLNARMLKDIDEQGMFPLPYTKKAYDTVRVFINNLVKKMTEENPDE